MLSFHDAAAIAAAPTTAYLDPALRQLLADRVHDWAATDLLDLTHLLIVQAGDTEQTIMDEVAFTPLVNPLDGSRFGSEGFQPSFDWLSVYDDWAELIFTVSNSGFAFHIFVEIAQGTDPELLALCRTYAGEDCYG